MDSRIQHKKADGRSAGMLSESGDLPSFPVTKVYNASLEFASVSFSVCFEPNDSSFLIIT